MELYIPSKTKHKTNTKEIILIVVRRSTNLEDELKFYFQSLNTDYDWAWNYFIKLLSNHLKYEKKMVSIFCDDGLKIKNGSLPIATFWISIKKEYLSAVKKALTILIQFLWKNMQNQLKDVVDHLTNLKKKLNIYILLFNMRNYDWFQNPFIKFYLIFFWNYGKKNWLLYLVIIGLKMKNKVSLIDTFWI